MTSAMLQVAPSAQIGAFGAALQHHRAAHGLPVATSALPRFLEKGFKREFGVRKPESRRLVSSFGNHEENEAYLRDSRPLPTWAQRMCQPKKAMLQIPALLMVVAAMTFHANPALAASAATMSMTEYWRYFFAGGLCACLSHSIATPVDVVKTRQQTDPEKYQGKSIAGVFKQIVNEEGPRMLLQGLAPTALGYLFEGALKFGFYELMKPVIFSLTGGGSKVLDYLLSGMVAGTIAALALCPLEAARIRLVADPKFAKNLLDAIPKMTGENGAVRLLFSGLPAQLAKQVPYTMTKQVSFDFLTAYMYTLISAWGMDVTQTVKWSITFSGAFLAAGLSTIASQPGDMLLSAVNKRGGDKRRSTGDALKRILEKDGFSGLFRGLNARILHVGAIVTAQLVMYDIIKQLVGIAATGSK